MTESISKKINDRLYVSTVSSDAIEVADKYGIGIEIAQYCTAWNMDEYFSETDLQVKSDMTHADRFVFHAPFNELCPAAIDKKVLENTYDRYSQAVEIAEGYGISRMVCHSGYVPLVYFKNWFHDRSVEFWKNVLKKYQNMTFFLENVLEDEPYMLTEIVKEIDDPRFRLCLDIGHANSLISELPISEWVNVCAPYIGHIHIHNNEGGWDVHDPLFAGTIPMKETLELLISLMPEDATITLETLSTESSMEWLADNNFIDRR